jgi:iron complex outermembrane receptor protein
VGGFSTVSVRGASSGQVLVLLDNVPLNQALGGAVNIGDIPLSNVERIEVYRGHAPVRFNTAPIGGVVNIVTRGTSAEPVIMSQHSMGSFGTHAQDVYATARINRWDHAVNAGLQGSTGNFNYADDNATPFNATDDTHTVRENNAYRAVNLSWKGARDGGPSERLRASADWFNKSEGVPGLGTSQSRTAGLSTQRAMTTLRWERDNYLFGATTLAAEIQYSQLRQSFYDPFDEIGTGNQDNSNDTRRTGLVLELTGAPRPNHFLTFNTQWSRETFSPHDALAAIPLGRNSRRTTLTTALEDQISLFNDRLLLIPSARMESFDSDFTDTPFTAGANTSVSDTLTSAYLGARYRLNRAVTLRANGGNYHRTPSLYELFGDRGFVIGNADLKPEKGENYDFGFILDLNQSINRNGIFELSAFVSEVENLITFIQNSQRTAVAMNVSRAEINGVEAALQLQAGPRWLFSSNYTYQETEDDGDVPFWRGNQLPGRHENQFNFTVKNTFGAGHAWFFELARDNGNFLDAANLKPVPARNIQNLGLTWNAQWGKITFEVKNFGDEQVSDVVGFPLPGRSFNVTINMQHK